jgi:ectoine hydroxylase-related dioxygenase (phytanoyl-CoA dioxygenase family)
MHTISKEQIGLFREQGYLVIPNLLLPEEIALYRSIYEDFLHNRIDASRYRSDLGGHAADDVLADTERITQIMVPSKTLPALLTQPLHTKTLSIARQLLGEDMALDFDMLIDKAPFSHTPTPWHQDAAYWIKMPDTRAASCWTALDAAEKDNGCMWYIPGSHTLPLRAHHPAGRGGGALECEAYEHEGVAVELNAGDGVFHHGGTAHYSRGNITAHRRRAFITNFRPQAMIDLERAEGFDHTGERKVRNK